MPESDRKPEGRRAVFIDRDGVINQMVFHADFGIVDSPANPDQFLLCDGVGEGIAKLKQAGFLVIIVSNQPGIAKGKFTPALLSAIEDKLIAAINCAGGSVDAIYNCLHHPDAAIDDYRVTCTCRKPLPGLLLRAAQEWDVDLHRSYMIGDGVTDVLAGSAAGTITLFVNSRKCYNCDSLARHNAKPDYIVADLREAVTVIDGVERGDRESVRPYVLKCS